MVRVGLISDTHGLLRPEAVEVLRGCHHIIHAGDICDPLILEQLASLAPLTAVRGNNDSGAWARELAEAELVSIGEVSIYVIHDLAAMQVEPSSVGASVVVSGHSHMPHVRERGGVLFVNPGSAGRRRFKLPVSVAELHIQGKSVSAQVVELALENAA
ncbi:MAG: metallophosphoesterase family protein [Piscinibacter sp.]|uniref:metallophosphoesterase family protein n=1 Tax=Piscinibacter sp. TaxID=1903157 RepID=UPI00258377F4|nr:metallophosphoesterase family protein [Piscinibacter sp.]MCW5664646.1 metallophosphoesterase family protein [Piscinibacter sp.]